MKKKNLMLIIFIGLFVCIGFYFWKKELPPQGPAPVNGPTNKPKELPQQQPTQIDNTPQSEYYEEHNIDNNEESQIHQQQREPRRQEDPRQHGDSRQGETPIEQLNFTQNTYNTQKASPYQTVSIKL